MSEIIDVYNDVVDEDMSMEEKQKAIAESDRLHVAGRYSEEVDEPTFPDMDTPLGEMSLDELKTLFETKFSQVYELECYSASDVMKKHRARTELYRRGVEVITEEVWNPDDEQGAKYEIQYVSNDEEV